MGVLEHPLLIMYHFLWYLQLLKLLVLKPGVPGSQGDTADTCLPVNIVSLELKKAACICFEEKKDSTPLEACSAQLKLLFP